MEVVPLLNEKGDYEVVIKNVKLQAVKVSWEESLKLWKIATPLVINILCQYATGFVAIVFLGHLGELQLSAVSLSTGVISGFTFGVMLGMGSALETLCGQAYGAGQLKMLGTYMQRSWIVLLLSALVLLPFYILAAPILKLLGQDHDIANLAGTFTILTRTFEMNKIIKQKK